MIKAILLAAGQSKRLKGQNKLIKKFKSFSNIKKQSRDDLIKIVGAKRADTLLRYFKINIPKD